MACKGRYTPLGFKIQKEEIQMRNLKRALSLALAAIMLIDDLRHHESGRG